MFVLGGTEARSQDGTVLPLGGPKVRALRTVPAAQANRPVAPETLIAEVWADDPPTDAPGALQALIARLRKALGQGRPDCRRPSRPGSVRRGRPWTGARRRSCRWE
jgi:DNA-binding SARP family transcriptional activator